MKRNPELDNKLPMYALDALEEAEMKEIDQYIQHFPEVAAELQQLREAASLLPFAAPLRTPPPDIKMSILNHAKANPRMSKTAEQTAKIKAVSQAQQATEVTPSIWENLTEWWRSLKAGPAFPVALALTLVAIGVVSSRLLSTQSELTRLNSTISQLTSDVNVLTDDVETLTADNRSLESTVENLEAENEQLAIANQTMLAELEDSDRVFSYAADYRSHRLRLPGTDAQPSASGGLFIRPETGELLLVISQLEPLTEEQIYQLWLIEDQPTSAGLIKITPDGTGIFEIDLALDSFDFSAVGVSVEPAGGSELPTGDIVMFAEL